MMQLEDRLDHSLNHSRNDEKYNEENHLAGDVHPHFLITAIGYEVVQLRIDLFHFGLRRFQPSVDPLRQGNLVLGLFVERQGDIVQLVHLLQILINL